MVINARFASVCPTCRQRIEVGESVNWARGTKAAHAACPERLPDDVEILQAIVNGYAEGSVRQALAMLDTIEARLFAEYEAGQVAENNAATDAAMLPKGIYRVSLTGAEKVYGTDHVNVQVVPNLKYENVKVGEWHGESIGTYSTARGFRYWPSVDPTGARTLAIKAAFAVLIEAADPIEYAKAYAVAASSCWRCGADLVDEQSRARLMGPDCYRMQNERGA